MKLRYKWTGGILAFFCSVLSAQEYRNTIRIEPDDTHEMVVWKAAHVVPTENQFRALENEFIAFIHFGPNTFTRMEWGSGKEDPRIFDLKNLDTDQWCEAMKAAGMRMVLITAKHHDGFVLWQSRYTRHGIMSTGFRDGKGDVLKDLSASCRKYGLKFGIYLSPADLFQIESPEGLYGNMSRKTLRTIPREVPGRPFRSSVKFKFEVDDYNEYFLNQLFELLTEYGPIHEVWFDGAHPKRKGGQTYDYAAWKELIHTLAPEAVIFGREDVRWCGNEAGKTRNTEWNVIPYTVDPDTATYFPDMTSSDLGSREQLYKAKFLHYQQAETNTSIREGWFYRDDVYQRVRSADDVFDIYERSVGGNSTFLLNIPPNRDGCFSDEDVRVLNEVGKRIRETYGKDLSVGAKGPYELLDRDNNTFVEIDGPVEIDFSEVTTINRIVLQEPVHVRGERVEKHAVDAWIDGEWKEVAQATNIGYKRILRFPEVATSKIRIRILASRLTPALSTVSAHFYASRPPRLMCRQDVSGMVYIEPLRQDFNWKYHGEDVVNNLASGFTIHYTTDGSEPTAKSAVYTKPFFQSGGIVRALSVLNGCKGAVMTERVGMPKAAWKVLEVSSEADGHSARLAFDADVRSYWKSNPGSSHIFSLDLGKVQLVNGFAYVPQKENSEGMIARGKVQISSDGNTWTDCEVFEFGNLVNDPSRRFHYFATPVNTRFIRWVAQEIAASGQVASMAEIELF